MDMQRNAAGAAPLGILGGTFDPIHYAHLLLAEHAREQLGLSRVVFIPSARPPHKLDSPVTEPGHRYEMARLATASNPYFEVSRREMDRHGPSYSITTIREIAAETGASVYFIVGADSVLDMVHWRQPDDILSEAHVATAGRPGFDMSRIPEALGPERAGKVQVFHAPLSNVSSTMIRERVAHGQSIRYMVPESVEQYIRQHDLYQG